MDISEKDVPNALIHMYRGELGRMTQYRVRLDTTTNWAVGTTAAITTFALSSRELPHYVLSLPVLLNLLFLWMESRRFRGMVLIAQRVRLLERGFYVQALGGEHLENWHRALVESLRHPTVPITYLQAFSVRLRRNYIWLIATVYVTWLVKLDITGRVVEAATIGSLPGTVVLTIALVTLVPLLVIAGLYHPPEEG